MKVQLVYTNSCKYVHDGATSIFTNSCKYVHESATSKFTKSCQYVHESAIAETNWHSAVLPMFLN